MLAHLKVFVRDLLSVARCEGPGGDNLAVRARCCYTGLVWCGARAGSQVNIPYYCKGQLDYYGEQPSPSCRHSHPILRMHHHSFPISYELNLGIFMS